MYVTTSMSSKLGTKRPRCSICGQFVGKGGNIGEKNYCSKCVEHVVNIETVYPWISCPLCEGTGNYLGTMCQYCSGIGHHEVKE